MTKEDGLQVIWILDFNPGIDCIVWLTALFRIDVYCLSVPFVLEYKTSRTVRNHLPSHQ